MSLEAEKVPRWIPLEGNPEVFNKWAEKAGLNMNKARFVDIYGLDPSLLAMVPETARAVVLCFPLSGQIAKLRKEDDEKIAASGQPSLDPTIYWVKQTVGNACGTMALIHSLANAGVTFTFNSPLAKFISSTRDKQPIERVKAFESTPLFAGIHSETAAGGQTAPPSNTYTELHFTCFVAAPDASYRDYAKRVTAGETEIREPSTDGTGLRIVELDGSRSGPIDRGPIKNDFLTDVAEIIQEQFVNKSASISFSMMALVEDE